MELKPGLPVSPAAWLRRRWPSAKSSPSSLVRTASQPCGGSWRKKSLLALRWALCSCQNLWPLAKSATSGLTQGNKRRRPANGQGVQERNHPLVIQDLSVLKGNIFAFYYRSHTLSAPVIQSPVHLVLVYDTSLVKAQLEATGMEHLLVSRYTKVLKYFQPTKIIHHTISV